MMCVRGLADFFPVEVAVVAAVFEERVVGMGDPVRMAVENLLPGGDCAAEASVIVYRQPQPFAAKFREVVFQGGIADAASRVPVQNDSFDDGVSECDSFFHIGSYFFGSKVIGPESCAKGMGMRDGFL